VHHPRIKFKNLRERLTYANVMATVAMFLALGGGAWALSQNSVGTRQLKPNAVRSSDVRNEALRGVDLRPNAITGPKVAPDSLTGANIDEGSLNLGSPNFHGNTSENNSDSPKNVLVHCSENAGEVVAIHAAGIIGGTVGSPPNATTNVVLTDTRVEHVLTGDWASATAYEVTPTPENWQVFISCVSR
jgi:hypothetical protein